MSLGQLERVRCFIIPNPHVPLRPANHLPAVCIECVINEGFFFHDLAERLFSLISEDRISKQAKPRRKPRGLPRMSGVTLCCLQTTISESRGLGTGRMRRKGKSPRCRGRRSRHPQESACLSMWACVPLLSCFASMRYAERSCRPGPVLAFVAFTWVIKTGMARRVAADMTQNE